MQGVNKWTVIGNLGEDPEIRYSNNGKAIANFSVACNRKWTNKDTGEQKENTEWVRVVAFGRLAEICGEYLKKGAPVYVDGRAQTDQYEKEGQTHYSTKLVANEMRMLGGDRQQSGGGQQRQQGQTGQAGQPKQQGQQPQNDAFEDDIPF